MGESATTSSKSKYFTKTVRFGGKELILYSLDGATWSTRRQELAAIKERQEAQRITLADIKGVDEEEQDRSEEESESNDEHPVILNDGDDVDEEVPAKKPVPRPAITAKARVTALPPLSERKLKQVIPAKAKAAQKEKPAAKKPVAIKAAEKPAPKKARAAKREPKKVGKAKPALVKGRKKAA